MRISSRPSPHSLRALLGCAALLVVTACGDDATVGAPADAIVRPDGGALDGGRPAADAPMPPIDGPASSDAAASPGSDATTPPADGGIGFTCPGAIHHISPSGSDGNTGAPGAPWKTFAYATDKARLAPGDCLLLESGVYTRGSTGLPDIGCKTFGKASDGTATLPITIAAVDERKALLQGDGTAPVFAMRHCDHWRVEGLHVEDVDGSTPSSYSAMEFQRSTQLVVRRNLIAHANRCQNSHLVAFDYGNTGVLLEENEGYYYHRHAFVFFDGSNGNEARRNYANSRAYPMATTCDTTVTKWMYNPVGGDTGGMNYGGSMNSWENDISENNRRGFGNETVGTFSHPSDVGGTPVGDDLFEGCISLRDVIGTSTAPHRPQASSHDFTWSNFVVVDPTALAVYPRSTSNAVLTSSSLFVPSAGGYVAADIESATIPDAGTYQLGAGSYSFTGTDTVVVGPAGGSYTNFSIQVPTSTLDHLAVNGGTVSNKPATSSGTQDAMFGGCYLWVPDASPLKRAGSGGKDIGASILHAVEGGVQTGKRLWDPQTGAPLFAGAVVAGLNDAGAAGGSLVDIAARLHIGPANGCPFPSGY